jgi:exoribonuclease R
MNRKNRMAQLASQASVQFNTFQFFKFQKEENRQVHAIVMRMTPAGVYVLIKKYGIEGMLIEDT